MKQKLIIILVISIIMMFCISTTILAVDTSQYKPIRSHSREYSRFTEIGGNFISVIQYVGIILGTVMMAAIGIKYMLGSVEEKAEYKQTMIPYIVGCVILFASSTLVGIIGRTVEPPPTQMELLRDQAVAGIENVWEKTVEILEEIFPSLKI